MAAARRGDLGGARPTASLHALQGDGVARLRPCRAKRRGVRARGPGEPLAGRPRRDPRAGLPRGLRPGARRLHAVVRLAVAGRERTADPARRLPSRRRRAGHADGGRDRASARRRRARHAIRHRRGERRGRRAPAGRGHVPPLLVLARPGVRPPGPAGGGRGAVRAAPAAAQRSRSAVGGVRRRVTAARRELPAGLHAPRARGRGADARRERPREDTRLRGCAHASRSASTDGSS